MATIDPERLINAVEARPAIWDMRSPDYSNKFKKRDAWEEIISLFVGETASVAERKEMGGKLQARWKNLRDRYARHVKDRKLTKSGTGAKKKPPYVYASQMSFLGDIIEINATTSSLDKTVDDPTENGDDDINNLPLYATPESPEADPLASYKEKPEKSFCKRKKLDPVELKIITALDANTAAKKEAKLKEDEDFHFLMSLHPSMQNIPQHLKMACRMEMMQVVNRHMQSYTHNQYQRLQPVYHTQNYSTTLSSQSKTHPALSPSESVASYASGYADESDVSIY